MDSRPESELQRHQLQLALDRLSVDLVSIESELAATRAMRSGGADDDEHDPDGIPLSSVLEVLDGRKMRLVRQFRETQTAMVDLDDGRYGICKTCSRPIGAQRLEIRPAAQTCIRCAR